MLGRAMDAEDLVQETCLRYQTTPPETIRSLKAFLTTILTRLCVDQLHLARRKREVYVGPWLPEPILTTTTPASEDPAERVEREESISLAFYRDVLGARVLRELAGTLCFLSFAGSQILLSAPFGSRSDQPVMSDPPPLDRTSVISELSIRVPDCLAAYEVLRSRGAEFLTPPFEWGDETRAFFHDPDGHLLEIRQVREAEVRSE